MESNHPEKSERLMRLLKFLRSRGKNGATTLEIARATRGLAVHSDVDDLRKSGEGYEIDCSYEQSRKGRRIYRYTLVEHG